MSCLVSGCCFLLHTWLSSTTSSPRLKWRPTRSSSIAQVRERRSHKNQLVVIYSLTFPLFPLCVIVRTPPLRSPTSGRAPKRRLITPIPGQYLPPQTYHFIFTAAWTFLIWFNVKYSLNKNIFDLISFYKSEYFSEICPKTYIVSHKNKTNDILRISRLSISA